MTERSYDFESRLSRLENWRDSVTEDLAEIKSDVRETRDYVVGGKGSWVLISAILGAVASAGGVLTYLSGWFQVRP